jgi:D-amino-acid dehydrogenase
MAYNRWAGLRPVTPDGLPVLDRLHPLDNVYISTGHSMLGITLAPASGIAMAEFIQTGRRPQILRPFSVARL